MENMDKELTVPKSAQINLGAFGGFSAGFGTVGTVFHYSTIISKKAKPLYPNPKYSFGIGI